MYLELWASAANLHTKPSQTRRLGSSKFVKEDPERNKVPFSLLQI